MQQEVYILYRFSVTDNYICLKSFMSFFGVQLNAQANRLLLEIRLKLSQNKFMPNFRTIYRSLAQKDPEISGILYMTVFEKALNENGLFFKKYEIQVFQKAYAAQMKPGHINWFNFMSHLREPMGPLRRSLVQNIFDNIDTECKGQLTPEALLAHFNPTQIESFKKGLKSEERIHEEFLGLLSMPDGVISRDEFIAYYDDLNINFPHNDVFVRFVSSMWNHTPEKTEAVKEEQVKAAIKALRFKLIQKSQGTKDQFLLRKLFEQFDRNHNYSIGTYELDLMMKKLEVPVAPRFVQPILVKLDKNCSGYIEYDEFKKFLFFDPWPV